MTPEHCHRLFSRLQAQNPHPKTELHYNTSFELLIAVILSAQATDKSVNKATAQLFQVANTPSACLTLGEQRLQQYIKAIGLSKTKARNIINTCRILVEQYEGQVPQTRKALEALPGVGRKTANVMLNTAFGQATIAVDTHIFRAARRIGLADGQTVRAVEEQLMTCVPPEFQQHAHHWLILHGRYVCLARRPQCSQCLIVDLCAYLEKNLSS